MRSSVPNRIDGDELMSEKPVTEMTTEELDAMIQSGAENPAHTPDPEPEQKSDPPAQPDKEPAPELMQKLMKQLEDAQSMIGRQANEIGNLRKTVAEMTPKPAPVTADQVLSDPVNSTKKLVQEELAERQRKDQEAAQAQRAYMEQAAKFITEKVPNVIDLLPAMAEELKEDGLPDDYIQQFIKNPLSENPVIVVQLAKRAAMKREVLELKNGKIELERKPGELVEKINQAAKTKPAVSGSHGRASGTGTSGYTREQITKMSTKELEELMKQG